MNRCRPNPRPAVLLAAVLLLGLARPAACCENGARVRLAREVEGYGRALAALLGLQASREADGAWRVAGEGLPLYLALAARLSLVSEIDGRPPPAAAPSGGRLFVRLRGPETQDPDAERHLQALFGAQAVDRPSPLGGVSLAVEARGSLEELAAVLRKMPFLAHAEVDRFRRAF
jgi:hypothetical protein